MTLVLLLALATSARPERSDGPHRVHIEGRSAGIFGEELAGEGIVYHSAGRPLIGSVTVSPPAGPDALRHNFTLGSDELTAHVTMFVTYPELGAQPAPGTYRFYEELQISGGTGEFAGATGRLASRRATLTLAARPDGTLHAVAMWRMKGEIRLPS